MKTHIDWDPIIKDYPSNISLSLDIMSKEDNSVRRLLLLVHSYSQIVRTITLILVSIYIETGDKRNNLMPLILTMLKRPSLGHWLSLLEELSQSIPEIENILFKFKSSFREITNHEFSECIHFDYFAPKKSLNGFDAFLQIRNWLAHGGIIPPSDESEYLAEKYEQILFYCISKLDFLRHHPIFVYYDQEKYKINGLIVTKIFTDSKSFQTIKIKTLKNDLVLSPLFRTAIGQTQSEEGFTENMYTFDGYSNNKIYYIGVTHRLNLKDSNSEVLNFLTITKKSRDWAQSNEQARIITKSISTVTELRGSKYFPETYIERPFLTGLVNELINDSQTQASGLLLTAESGGGKTSFLCRLVENLSNKSNNPHILPLFILAKNLPLPTTTYDPYLDSFGVLGEYISNFFKINCSGWISLFKWLNEHIINFSSVRFVIIIDAINEYTNSGSLLREVDFAIDQARRFTRINILATIRKTSYDRLIANLRNEKITFPKSERAYLRADFNQKDNNISIFIENFSEKEAKRAYDQYQYRARKNKNIACCQTQYNLLPNDIQQLLRRPFLLKIFMMAFNRREIPIGLSPVDIFHAYQQQVLTSTQSNLALYIANICYNNNTNILNEELSNSIINDWERGKDSITLLVQLNPIQQMVDLGILIQNNLGGYSFVHQLYFEYLIYSNLSKILTPDSIIIELEAIITKSNSYLEEVIGAFQILVYEIINKSSDNDILKFFIKNLHMIEFLSFLIPVLSIIKRIGKNNIYSHFVMLILNENNSEIKRQAVELFRILGDRNAQIQILEQLLTDIQDPKLKISFTIIYIRLLIMSNKLREAKKIIFQILQEAKLLGDSSLLIGIYTELGYFGFVTGDSNNALINYGLALQLLEASSNFSNESFLQKKSEIIGGRGCVEHNLDDNAACLASHMQCLQIDRSLNNVTSVAMDLVNLADAQWGCYHIGESLNTYEKAVDLSQKTCYKDALDVALIGKAIVLWSIGEYSAAQSSFRQGIEYANELNYQWDITYGLIYQSNLWACLGSLENSIKQNEEALKIAKEAELQYLEALALAYLCWKKIIYDYKLFKSNEYINIDVALEICRKNQLNGIEIMIKLIEILYSITIESINDATIENKILKISDFLVSFPSTKGVLELLGLDILHFLKLFRPEIDTFSFEDIIYNIIRLKRNSLSFERQATFIKTRVGWASNVKIK